MATVRLQKVKEEYGDRISINWLSFPLAFTEVPKQQFAQHSAVSRRRAGFEEEGIRFSSWDPEQPPPTSSLPSLRAAKCVRLQGEQAFQWYHMALFRAFFGDCRDISDRQVLIDLAKEGGLDVDRFISDFDRGSQENEVWAEYEYIQANYEGWGVPIAIVGDRYPVLGACPIDLYRRAVELCLASQSG